jgi:predicted transcriptional regulator
MMKAVLISTQPKWAEKIANGEKTIEVRKSRPKLETPFKVYIYCTVDKKREVFFTKEVFDGEKGKWAIPHVGNGKVIGEFVCDRIEDFSKWEFDYPSLLRHINLFAGTNGDYKFLDYYLKGQKKGYGWNISDLKIYDKPKELSEFARVCVGVDGTIKCDGCEYYNSESNESIGYFEECTCNYLRPLKRPPQSWCYVEELQNG